MRAPPIAGADVPNVDGILLEGGRLWAVQNFGNQITELKLHHRPVVGDGRTRDHRPTSRPFEIPTTVARFGDRLAVVNAKFDTGFPPTAAFYDVVVVEDPLARGAWQARRARA